MNPLITLIVYCVLIVVVSLLGGRLSLHFRMTHLRTQLLLSAVGGLMLGIALLHLMPHAGSILGSFSKVGIGTLIGLTSMFLLIRLFHTHDHSDDDSEHAHKCEHPHHHGHEAKGVSWAGLFFGLGLHTLVDGVALASSVLAEHSHVSIAGLGTFLAVLLHKPLDAFAITSVMKKQGWSERSQNLANAFFSMACPAGAMAFYFGATQLSNPEVLGWGLAVSAGFFIGIALGDLLPEVAFHDHDRGKLTLAFLLGISLAIAIENLPGHNHDGPDEDGDSHAGHDHSGHSHHFLEMPATPAEGE